MSVTKQELNIGGLPVNIYSKVDSVETQPVVAFFLLHGRHGSAEGIDPVARMVVEQATSTSSSKRDLVVVTFVSSTEPIPSMACFDGHGRIAPGPQEPWTSAYGSQGK